MSVRKKVTIIHGDVRPAARGDSVDTVLSVTGTGFKCFFPIITSTNEKSPDVFVNSIGSVRLGDIVNPHPKGGCGVDVSPLTLGAFNVFINSKNAGRLEDIYTPDNIIITGSENVFIGRRVGPMGPQGPPGPSAAGQFLGLEVDTRKFDVVKVPLETTTAFNTRSGPAIVMLNPIDTSVED